MYTVAQILSPDFRRSWSECVALVGEIADTLGTSPTVPAAEDMFLQEDGSISLGFAAEQAVDPVMSLATLLADLLERTDAPAALRTLAAENARPNPAHGTVARFSQALAFFERPDRRNDVRALVGRLAGLGVPDVPVDADAEVQRIREKIGALDAQPPAPAPEKVRPKRLQIAVAAIIVIALVATVGAVRLVRIHRANPVSIIASAEGIVANALTSGLNRLTGTVTAVTGTVTAGAVSEVAAPRGPEKGKGSPRGEVRLTAEAPPGHRAPAPASASARLFSRTESKPSNPRRETISQAVSGSVPLGPGPRHINAVVTLIDPDALGTTPFADSSTIYSPVELEVSPPRLQHPQLPREPAPGADTGYFDLLIDESGDVESVRLISPAHRYQDRMLVAAAKAWKFKPATLHGIPVKYRLRMPIILQEPAR
jgi:hypothetical protein